MKTELIGKNAGVVWRTLHNNRYSWEELLRATQLDSLDLACAIGWLAREGKVLFSPEGDVMYLEVYQECYY